MNISLNFDAFGVMLLDDFRAPLLSFQLIPYISRFPSTVEQRPTEVSYMKFWASYVPEGKPHFFRLPSKIFKLSIYILKLAFLKTFLQQFELCFDFIDSRDFSKRLEY